MELLRKAKVFPLKRLEIVLPPQQGGSVAVAVLGRNLVFKKLLCARDEINI